MTQSGREMQERLVAAFFVMLFLHTCLAQTDPHDVFAINSLYTSLNSPPINGWVPSPGDPCGQHWEGVECVFTNITSIILTGRNLTGQLGNDLNYFTSLITLNLTNNSIGGTIPSNLPLTVKELSLSDNQLNGSIPDSFSTLTQLSDLDLSSNNLSGQLPPYLGSLPSLSTLYLQNNHLSGKLDVLNTLPLQDLNIGNNLFSGPIPVNLLNIPIFKKDGNPFNTTLLPSPPPARMASPPTSSLSSSPSPSPSIGRLKQMTSTDAPPQSAYASRSSYTDWILYACISGILALVIAIVLLLNSKRNKNIQEHSRAEKDPGKYMVKSHHGNEGDKKASLNRHAGMAKVESLSSDDTGCDNNAETKITISVDSMPPPQAPPLLPSRKVSHLRETSSSFSPFTIASLQQYTNSFSTENFIGHGMLGAVYKAQLPCGKLVAVRKLEDAISSHQTEREFLALVSNLSKLVHPNVIRLVGYCSQHGHRLLIHEYCSNGSLFDALHSDEEIRKTLSWATRIKIALEAARALKYLHEACKPPIMHMNFSSSNLLLDENFAVRLSDCGLARFMSFGSAKEIFSHLPSTMGYNAPESEVGSYTLQTDVYTFGVVMLELLTGRQAYDSSQPWGEQFLARWAISRLHDIDGLTRMVDPTLQGACSSRSLSRFADIISSCIQSEPEFRHPISQIVQDLLEIIQRESA